MNKNEKGITTVILVLLGAGFGPAILKEFFSFGFTISANHIWFFPSSIFLSF